MLTIEEQARRPTISTCAPVLFSEPNVQLLLFKDPSVVIVQVLTIRTLFSAQDVLHISIDALTCKRKTVPGGIR